MSTFGLWMALARGEVPADAMVWRDGLTEWCAVDSIPDLACAIPTEQEDTAEAPRESYTRLKVSALPAAENQDEAQSEADREAEARISSFFTAIQMELDAEAEANAPETVRDEPSAA